MDVAVALEVKLHARTRNDEGNALPLVLKKKEDIAINSMVQRRIGELEEEIRTYLNITRRKENDTLANRANRQRACEANSQT